MCAAFVVGRISHAIGLSMENTVNPFRIGGIVITAEKSGQEDANLTGGGANEWDALSTPKETQ